MRARTLPPDTDLEGLIDVICDPEHTAERQAEARRLLIAAMGPFGDATLRACGQALVSRRELNTLREKLGDGSAPQLRGIVTGVRNGRVRVLLGPTERLLARPDGLTLGIGQTVLTDSDGRNVVEAEDFLVGGQTYAFCERLEERYVLVQPLREGPGDDARQLAVVAACVDLDSLTPGDRVLGWSLEFGNVVLVTRRLGATRPAVGDDAGVACSVTREEIIGLDDIIDEAELLFLSSPTAEYAALLRQVHRAVVGVVFQGTTGCGKTMLAQYLVGKVRERGGRALYRTASHYLSKWVGEGAATLRADFAVLDASFKETGVRPLLVVDELEAIALDRSHAAALTGGHLDVLDTLLSLLTRTDARMIGISNVADRLIETALLRDGRLRVVAFPPTLQPEQVAALVAQCLANVPLAAEEEDEGSAYAFGNAVSDLIFAPSGILAELLRVHLADGRVLSFGARHLATPAAIGDGIVRPTLARLVQRDIRAGRRAPLPLTIDGLREATVHYFAQRCTTITRENVRSVLPGALPDDQALVKVERLPVKAQ